MKKLFLSAALVAGFSFATIAQENLKVSEDFIQHLVNNEPSKLTAFLSPEAKGMISEEDLINLSSELHTQLGTPVKIHGGTEVTETEGEETLEVVYYHVEYEMGDLDYKIVFNDEHQIHGFFIVPHEDRSEIKKN